MMCRTSDLRSINYKLTDGNVVFFFRKLDSSNERGLERVDCSYENANRIGKDRVPKDEEGSRAERTCRRKLLFVRRVSVRSCR